MGNDPLPHGLRELLPYAPSWSLPLTMLLWCLVGAVLLVVGYLLWRRHKRTQAAGSWLPIEDPKAAFEALLKRMSALHTRMSHGTDADTKTLASAYEEMDTLLRQAIHLKYKNSASAMTGEQLCQWARTQLSLPLAMIDDAVNVVTRSETVRFGHLPVQREQCASDIQALRRVMDRLRPTATHPYPTDLVATQNPFTRDGHVSSSSSSSSSSSAASLDATKKSTKNPWSQGGGAT